MSLPDGAPEATIRASIYAPRGPAFRAAIPATTGRCAEAQDGGLISKMKLDGP